MEKNSIEAIVRSLNEHEVQYMIVGGLAVVAHGYLRFTADVDLLFSVANDNLTRAVAALEALGYRPKIPVPFSDFIDAQKRQQWIAEKGAMVFSLFSPIHPTAGIDLFLEPPIDFAQAYARAARMDMGDGITATFCSIEDLIAMKTKAGRARDLEDIAKLRQVYDEGQS